MGIGGLKSRVCWTSDFGSGKLLKKVAKLPGLEKTLIPAEFNDILELDELWSFIGKKSNKSWTWIALCRRTRQIVGFSVGDRSVKTCCKLKASIPENYTNLKTYSDFLGCL